MIRELGFWEAFIGSDWIIWDVSRVSVCCSEVSKTFANWDEASEIFWEVENSIQNFEGVPVLCCLWVGLRFN